MRDAHLRRAADIIIAWANDAPWSGDQVDWLEYQLGRLATKVDVLRRGEADAPLRKDIRPRLEMLAEAARTVQQAVNDAQLCVFLGYGSLGDMLSEEVVAATMERLAEAAGSRARRLAGQGGSPIAYPGGGLSPQEWCAWGVKHLMILANRRNTADRLGSLKKAIPVWADNPAAIDTINALWQAAGGAALGSRDGNRPPTGWRKPLLALAKIEQAGGNEARALRSMVIELLAVPAPCPLEPPVTT